LGSVNAPAAAYAAAIDDLARFRRAWPGAVDGVITARPPARRSRRRSCASVLQASRGELSLDRSPLNTRKLQKHPQCSLLLLDLKNPYRYHDVRGGARIEPGDDYEVASKVGAKYGEDLSVRDRPGERRMAVTIEPTNVYAVDMTGGEPPESSPQQRGNPRRAQRGCCRGAAGCAVRCALLSRAGA
jgi:hypothetical protein